MDLVEVVVPADAAAAKSFEAEETMDGTRKTTYVTLSDEGHATHREKSVRYRHGQDKSHLGAS